jgi:putative ABC transport system ATP-binding protein
VVVTDTEPVFELRNIHKFYQVGEQKLHVLRGVDLAAYKGEYLAIMGPSGSGKSTLLNVLGMLDVPDSGNYFFVGSDASRLPEPQLARLRNRHIGFVFQTFNLFSHFTVVQNIEVPMAYARVKPRERRKRAKELAERVGLDHRMEHRPRQLSGGEMQRVAIARAMANDPPLILADEPTGNLDEATGDSILELFDDLLRHGKTILLVTHNPAYKTRVSKVLMMHSGRLEAQA